ncbi:MAG: adenosine kinase [Alphaproteobacteria bacterium]|nr:MAG: adenosine kinase [Alphaproteobacteria bacterium]
MSLLDVVGIGNAIVDVLSHTEDQFLEDHGLVKGSMQLIDTDQANALYAGMTASTEISGGSAANTIAGVAALGGKAAYIGKVADDTLGDIFAEDLRATNVVYRTERLTDGLPTARSMILVTPDAQRTMNTYLGASNLLSPADIDEDLISRAHFTYLEGYLWDPEDAKEAFRHAMRMAHQHNRKVALTLSDAFCVDRFREEFKELVKTVDLVFANEDEICSLYEVKGFDDALQAVRAAGTMAALTRSEKGSLLMDGDEIHLIDAVPDVHVVDTTGAGDLYAAGVLTGLTQGRSLGECGHMGSIAAAEIISHMGARPVTDLKALVEKEL